MGSRQRLVGAVAAVATVAAGAAVAAGSGAAYGQAGGRATDCPAPTVSLTPGSVPAGLDVGECGLVGETLDVGGLTMQIPTPGETLIMEALYEDGAELFTVAVDTAGVISYPDELSSAGTVTATSAPSACSDSAYTLGDEEQAGQWLWYLGDGTRPAGLSTAETRDALKQTLTWLSEGYNDCGLAPGYSPYAVSSRYEGTSTLESDIRLDADGKSVCGDGSTDGRDHSSVVDFGNLDKPGYTTPLAMECTWVLPQAFNKNNILESDIRFNTTDKDFYYTKPSSCSGKYDLRGVAMHEFGHTFALKHVDEETHPHLTMSERTSACDSSQRTLGKGDLMGLAALYG